MGSLRNVHAGAENRSGSNRNSSNKGLFAVSVPAVAHADDRDDQLMVDDLVKNAVCPGPNSVFFLA